MLILNQLNLAKILNNNGQIIVGYLYDIENNDDYREVYKQELRNIIFNEPEYSYHYVKRMEDLHLNQTSTNHDACLIYTDKTLSKKY